MNKKIVGVVIFSLIFFWAKAAATYATYRQDNATANDVANNVTLWLGQAEPLTSSGADIWMSAHPWLALRTMQFFEQQYGKSLSQAQKVQIVWGSIVEDIDLEGSGVGRYGDVAPDSPLGRIFSGQWDIHLNRAENHFYSYSGDEDGLTYGPGVDTAQNVSSWRWAEGSDLNNYDFWDGVAYGHSIDGWRALGQVLHLLEDASVPAHVRNDLHLIPDDYEHLTDKSPSRLTGMFGEQAIEPVRMIASLRNYFDFVANFSRSNFYSDDSFFQSNSCGYDYDPAERPEQCVQVPLVTIGREDEDYFYNTLGRKIGKKGLLFKIMERFGKRAEALVLAVLVDELVTMDIWQAVTPRVIAAGAGLMKYFFDQLPEIKECVDADGDGFGRDCPAGTDCDDVKPEINPQATELCDGIDNNCDYKIDENCPCQVSTRRSCGSDKGICKPGTQTCESSGWGECKGGVQPQPETCNGFDDDCDGEIDETLTKTCTTACGSGTEICKQGTWINCTAPQPAAEVCDNKDNDCDGQVDEDLTRECSSICGKGVETCISDQWKNCDARQPREEICNGIDDDCNTKIDEICPCRVGDKQECGLNIGICRKGSQTCLENGWGECVGEVKPTEEICNNLDDDCDGKTDETFFLKGKFCSTGVGECYREGVHICDDEGQGLVCLAEQVQSSEEICDNKDNDCDGEIDESCPCRVGDKQECGSNVGICRKGIQVCASNGWSECVGEIKPEDEKCNNLDDDCDGEIDNAVLNVCGECGPVPQEICDGQDNNCDGQIDEGFVNTEDVDKDGFPICANDCDDNNPSVNPAAFEICGNGVDDNCDGRDINCGSVEWRFAAGGLIVSSPAIGDDGTVYVASSYTDPSGRLYAISPSGTKKWVFGINDQIIASPAIGSDGTIYIVSDGGALYAINPDGTAKWGFSTNDAWARSSPAIGSDGLIYFGSGRGKLYAVNPYGIMEWVFATGGTYVTSSPAIDSNEVVYVGSSDGKLYAVNPDGTQKWEFATSGIITFSSPAIGSDGTVFIGSYDGGLYAVNSNGTRKWVFSTGSAVISSPAIGSDGVVYVGSGDNKLYAINPDGTKKWAFNAGSYYFTRMKSAPAIGSDGVVYIGSDDDKFYAINPDGTKRWEISVQFAEIHSSPAIGDNGLVYVGSYDGILYAISSTSQGLDDSSWPKFHHDNYNTGRAMKCIPEDEICDGKDNNCNGQADEGVKNACGQCGPAPEEICNNLDDDCDGEIDEGFDKDGDGIKICAGDCNDDDTEIYPGHSEICDGIDNDCDGRNDFDDTDQDGFYICENDCNDNNPLINPLATEICEDNIDSDCDGKDVVCGTKKWEFLTGGGVSSSPAISSDGTIYVGSWDGKLYAINPDGTKKWEFVTQGGIISSPAIGGDGIIYVGSRDDKLYAINPDGTKKWEFVTDGDVKSSPAIGNDGTVYICSSEEKLYAINPDGTKKWEFTNRWFGKSSPSISGDGTIYIGSASSIGSPSGNFTEFFAINPDGTKKWVFKTEYIIHSSPAIGSNGVIYVGSSDDKLYAIKPNGILKWKFVTQHSVESSPSIGSDGIIYVGSYDQNLYAIYPDYGTKKWEFKTNMTVNSSPAIGSDGVIYIGSEDNKLYAINPNGTKKWEFMTDDEVDSSPAIGNDGIVYVGSDDNKLYAIFSSSLGPANSSWPKFRHDNQNTGRQQ